MRQIFLELLEQIRQPGQSPTQHSFALCMQSQYDDVQPKPYSQIFRTLSILNKGHMYHISLIAATSRITKTGSLLIPKAPCSFMVSTYTPNWRPMYILCSYIWSLWEWALCCLALPSGPQAWPCSGGQAVGRTWRTLHIGGPTQTLIGTLRGH